MSLRAEINEALDEVSPEAPQLEAQVARLLLAQMPDKRVAARRDARTRWTRGFRGVITLVAAALVVVLIGGLILAGQLLRGMNAPPPGINQAALKQLEARPLQLPVVKPGDACNVSPLTDVSAHGPEALLFGQGPVYFSSLGYFSFTTDWGTWMALSSTVDTTTASGLVLIRAQDLQTRIPVVFVRYPFSPVGEPGDGIATGTVLGSEVVNGQTVQLHPQVVIDTSRMYAGTRNGNWPIYKSYMGIPKTATGCLGFQVDGVHTDGTTFTELIVVSVS
jgi:hypothetical protein